VAALGLCVGLGVTSDFFNSSLLSTDTWRQASQKSYFWFISPQQFEEIAGNQSLIEIQFKLPPTEKELEGLLEAVAPLAHKPDIFLIILESMRLDAVTPEVAPRLNAFRKESHSADRMFAGSHGSELSWFSILHGYHALRWQQLPRDAGKGAYPLRLLKRLGYDIQVRLAGDFRWKALGEIVFGAENNLTDIFIDSRGTLGNMTVDKRDRILMSNLSQEISNTAPGGRLYIQDFESPHWNYSWPPNFEVPYREYAPYVNFTKSNYTSDEVRLVKNRYLNAVSWVDHLFGKFVDHLKRTGRFDNSIVIVVGDHGEEFYENRRWAHGTRLSRQQTETPIFIKLPRRLGSYRDRRFIGHVDVMPTIFMALGVPRRFYDFLDGISIDMPRETLLLSSRSDNAEPGLVFANPERKARISYWSKRGGKKADRALVRDYVDFTDREIVSPKPASQTDARFLREQFPELIEQLFMTFTSLASDRTNK
ncbi:MAG: sulfatase-like hydrolase/transferase, partial [Gammaproteobacteria bacterium]|nr:sulfatase-like hydrolase/transferase [Gammaproteobacteria bacterium]